MWRPEKIFLVPSGYNFRAVLAFCRALEQAGHTPAVVACTKDDPIFRTRFRDAVVFTRANRSLEVADFTAAATAARKRTGATQCVLAPASEYMVRWALQQRDALAAAHCELPLPDEATYLRVTDKGSFTVFCHERGLPVPGELATGAHLPCVAKPRWNVAPDGTSLYPWLLRTREDLLRFERETQPEHFFFQEWVEGRSLYLLFHLPRRGRATVFSQENLAQQPGGKSVLLARAARLHEDAREVAFWEDALRATGFYGVAMLELRQRDDGECVLIEANPRLWGPLQLCVDACPPLLRGYVEEHLGRSPAARPAGAIRTRAAYLWSGGFAAGEPVWHGAAPRRGWLARLRHAADDVYLRADSWRQFMHEHRRASHTDAGRSVSEKTDPTPASLN